MSTDASTPKSADDRLRDAYVAASIPEMHAALAAGASPDIKLNTMPLVSHAAFDGNLEILDALIANGADLNVTDSLGLTAAMLLAWVGYQPKQIEALRRLIAANADLSLQ